MKKTMIKKGESLGEMKTAVIERGDDYLFNTKICGLYPLERLINVLAAAGIERIFLDLPERDLDFYRRKIAGRLKRIRSAEIITGKAAGTGGIILRVPAGLFMQQHYFNSPGEYFTVRKNIALPVMRDDQFMVASRLDARRGERLVEQRLLDTTHGYISKNINKKISVPMSTVISATRIHPNVLTLINFVIGTAGTWLVYLGGWGNIALGGTLFQLASVFDGVDGEVAKFTFRSSKLGGWLDTVCDHVILVFLFGAMSLHFYKEFGLAVSLAVIGTAVVGLMIMFNVTSSFLKRFAVSQSLKAYETAFILRLPPDDPKVAFILKTRYMVKKEFYSLIFFLVGLTGKIHYTIPLFALTVFVGGIILKRINRQYFPLYEEKYRPRQ